MNKSRIQRDRQEMDSIIRLTIRGFIAIILFFVILWSLRGCGGGGGIDYSLPPGFSVESPQNNNHAHSVWVKWTDLQAPPAIGVAYESTKDIDRHSHYIYLSQQQLQDANNGTWVTVNSTVSGGHYHVWAIP